MKSNFIKVLFFFCTIFFISGIIFAQTESCKKALNNGITLYNSGDYNKAKTAFEVGLGICDNKKDFQTWIDKCNTKLNEKPQPKPNSNPNPAPTPPKPITTYTETEPVKLIDESWRPRLRSAMNLNPTFKIEGGDRYKGEGDKRKGIAEGLGAYYWDDGRFYIGEWSNDEMNGLGIFISSDIRSYHIPNCPECVCYVGDFKYDSWYMVSVKSGEGKCYDKTGRLIYQGKFSNNEPTDRYPANDSRYETEKFQAVNLSNSTIYIGETKNGEPSGQGFSISQNGDIEYGLWENGVRYGGILIKNNGELYKKKIIKELAMTISNIKILFDEDKDIPKLDDYKRENIKNVADLLKKNPDLKVTISGYTEPGGDVSHNKDLGYRRALAVRKIFLEQHGVPADQIAVQNFTAEDPQHQIDIPETDYQEQRCVIFKIEKR